MIDFVATFILFFAVIDPIGTVPVFIAVTKGYEASEKRRIAFKASMIAAVILIFFVVAGEPILTAVGIPLSAFQVAGGIVLLLFALSMIFGESKPEEEIKLASSGSETAVFPLAIPSIAGPGAMLAAVMQTENARFTLFEQAQITGVILAILVLTMLLLMASTFVHKFIGDSGASLISRIMGLILASVAVSSVLSGIRIYFSL